MTGGIARNMFRKALAAVLGFALATALAVPSLGATVVPPGNRNAHQPPIPYGAVSRTRSTNGSFLGKYEKIRDLIGGDAKLRAKIKAAAARYGIDPVHIVGALIGEHTYNVDALDHIQTYVVKAASYLGSDLAFKYDGEKVTQFVAAPGICRLPNHRGQLRPVVVPRKYVGNKIPRPRGRRKIVAE